MFLLRGKYAVGLYNLQPSFSAEQTASLLDALANNTAKSEMNTTIGIISPLIGLLALYISWRVMKAAEAIADRLRGIADALNNRPKP